MTIQPGDEIVVENLVVLADSFHQLLDVLHVLAKDRVRITFLEEQISNTSLLQLDLLESVTLFTNLQTQLKSHATTFGLVEAKKREKRLDDPKNQMIIYEKHLRCIKVKIIHLWTLKTKQA